MALHRQHSALAERCPIRDVLDRLGDRWTVLVLIELSAGHTLRKTGCATRVSRVRSG